MRICPQCKQRTEDRLCPDCQVTTVDESVLAGEDLVGRIFADRYEVISCIGRGGMGAVYRARNVALDSPVALKVLHRQSANDLESIERFYREARSASRLTHPNTIRVFDFGHSEDGRLFIAMEYLEGRSLRAEMREAGRFVEPRILRVAEQVCKSLGEAHDAGLVHRDIKPENIFLTRMYGETDFVKVLDFGIARTAEAGTLTKTGVVVGTPKYMSPEQASSRRVDGRADLYSLGIVMYEMFAGTAPFSADTSVRLLMMHIQDPPPPLSERFGGEVSRGFERLVMALLAKDPDHRPQGAREVLSRIEDLKRSFNEESSIPTPKTASPRGTHAVRSPEIGKASNATLVIAAEDTGRGGSPSEPAATLVLPEPSSEPTPSVSEPVQTNTTRTPPRRPPPAPSDTLAVRTRRNVPWTRPGRLLAMTLVLAAALGLGAYFAGLWDGPDRIPMTVRSWLPFLSPRDAKLDLIPQATSLAPPAEPSRSSSDGSPPPPPPDSHVVPNDRPGPARVHLTTVPPGARVLLLPKGTDLGATPLDLFVPPSESTTLRLTRKGFRPVEITIPYDDALRNPKRSIPLRR